MFSRFLSVYLLLHAVDRCCPVIYYIQSESRKIYLVSIRCVLLLLLYYIYLFVYFNKTCLLKKTCFNRKITKHPFCNISDLVGQFVH